MFVIYEKVGTQYTLCHSSFLLLHVHRRSPLCNKSYILLYTYCNTNVTSKAKQPTQTTLSYMRLNTKLRSADAGKNVYSVSCVKFSQYYLNQHHNPQVSVMAIGLCDVRVCEAIASVRKRIYGCQNGQKEIYPVYQHKCCPPGVDGYCKWQLHSVDSDSLSFVIRS